MKKIIILFFLSIPWTITAQLSHVSGRITNRYDEALSDIEVRIDGSDLQSFTDKLGYYKLTLPFDFISGDLIFKKEDKLLHRIPIVSVSGKNIDLGTWTLPITTVTNEPLAVFNLEDFTNDQEGFDRGQMGSVLHARRDAFLTTAAFQFGSVFFRLRGLDNSHQEVRINGIPMNTFNSGRPQWGQWGGLNDFTNRGQRYLYGINGDSNGFGGFLATTEYNLRPSDFRSGLKVSQAFSNASYRFRSMISYIQTPKSGRPGYAFLISQRLGQNGYMDGTSYTAFSGIFLLEHQWNKKHHSWFTAIYTPNSRGKNAPLTQEVATIKGRQYNPYWGWQEGKQRNSRKSNLAMPVLIFNHHWQQRKDMDWQLNIGYISGEQASSRLRYNGHQRTGDFLIGGGQNPDPVYYQNLPSYALSNQNNPDYTHAFLLEQQLVDDGQINWEELYNANQATPDYGIYALYNDIQKPRQWTVTLQTKQPFSSVLKSRWEVYYSNEVSRFMAQPTDLLGATYLWDLDPYASTIKRSANNLLEPNRPIVIGDSFLYHYGIHAQALGAAVTFDYSGPGWRTFLGFQFRNQRYQREGYFKNGRFPEQSLGRGAAQNFTAFSVKWGANYALNGRHRLFFFATATQKPPPYRNAYLNPREHHKVIPESRLEKGFHTNIGYQWQSPFLNIKVNGYWIQRKDIQEVSFYFADGLGGDEALFIQEAVTGMEHSHLGLEAAFTYQPIPEVKLVGVAALGRFLYANAPHLILASEPTIAAENAGFIDGIKDLGKTNLKNYALSGGPQRSFSLSFNYNDPNYWRMSVYGNYFSNAYLDPNPLTRSKNFYTDSDGLPFASYDVNQANSLLKQEQFPATFMLNATAGKSWLADGHYFGFFISLQNLLNTNFKTGGYEQGRNANYPSLLEDSKRSRPLFGPKYWWGRGTTYFTTIYFRF